MSVLVGLLTFGRTRVIVDWHNYGFTIMQVGGANRHLVSVARWYETFIGRFGWKHLTVSKAMKDDLVRIVAIPTHSVFVLYDCATSRFKALSDDEKTAIFVKIGLT